MLSIYHDEIQAEGRRDEKEIRGIFAAGMQTKEECVCRK